MPTGVPDIAKVLDYAFRTTHKPREVLVETEDEVFHTLDRYNRSLTVDEVDRAAQSLGMPPLSQQPAHIQAVAAAGDAYKLANYYATLILADPSAFAPGAVETVHRFYQNFPYPRMRGSRNAPDPKGTYQRHIQELQRQIQRYTSAPAHLAKHVARLDQAAQALVARYGSAIPESLRQEFSSLVQQAKQQAGVAEALDLFTRDRRAFWQALRDEEEARRAEKRRRSSLL